jgi:hypothetical protein
MGIKEDLIASIETNLLAALPWLTEGQKGQVAGALEFILDDFTTGLQGTLLAYQGVQADLDAATTKVNTLTRLLSQTSSTNEQSTLLTTTLNTLADAIETEGDAATAERIRQAVLLALGLYELNTPPVDPPTE